jgi:hypothetical protein
MGGGMNWKHRCWSWALLAFVFLLPNSSALAQAPIHSHQGPVHAKEESASRVPLSRFLRTDGTLDLPSKGIPGNIDPAGLRLASGPGEVPRFESGPATDGPEAIGDDCWDTRFHWRGMNDRVQALAWDGTNLYAAGSFTRAGGVAASRIAKWDGTAWSALGTGIYGSVSALAWDGANLYAGGDFTWAGGEAANYVAKWDGTAWSPLGTGLGSSVSVLAWCGNNLYAGGWFTSAGGVVANCIAKWDGTAWSALGAGRATGVQALAWDGTNLYAGGRYQVAKWDGTAWTTLGTGMDNEVQALAWEERSQWRWVFRPPMWRNGMGWPGAPWGRA